LNKFPFKITMKESYLHVIEEYEISFSLKFSWEGKVGSILKLVFPIRYWIVNTETGIFRIKVFSRKKLGV
jgi:hypothetical protein